MHPTQSNDNNGEAESSDQQVAHSQTDHTDAQHQVSQTEAVGYQDNDVQTNEVDTKHSSIQTAPKQEQQKSQQTEGKTLLEADAQTEFIVKIVHPSSDIGCQAGSWNPCDTGFQTDQSLSLMVEGDSQTEVKQSEVICQTDATITYNQNIQTEVDIIDNSCQTVKDEKNVTSQTEIEAAEANIQTEWQVIDAESQAIVDIVELGCQASVDYFIVQTQTDCSMSLLTEQGAQASVISTEQDMQTNIIDNTERFVQTEIATSQKISQTEHQQEDQHSQTNVVELTEIETQTDEIPVEVPEANIDTNILQTDTAVDSQTSSYEEVPEMQVEVESPTKRMYIQQAVPELSEEGSQTDPVTIIIGDASFLVKKLKSSSLSPTKVSSMGNEIEIELRADEEESVPSAPACPYDMPEKENAPLPIVTSRPRGNLSAYRARGVRTRGGSVQRGGYRMDPQYSNQQVVYQTARSNTGGQYYASSAGGVGKYSCPVCSDTFHESPALYEHLQLAHSEAFGLIKKPKGREGKTIQLKKVADPEPPVLTPMEPIGIGQQQLQHQTQVQHIHQVPIQQQPIQQVIHHQQIEVLQSNEIPSPPTTSEQVLHPEPEPPGAELFEDPGVWQSPNKSRKRTLARRQITDEEVVEEPQEEPTEEMHLIIQPSEEITDDVVVGKRKRGDQNEDVTPKRACPQAELVEEPTLEDAEIVHEEDAPKRRSRSSMRIIKQEKVEKVPEVAEEVKPPRPRGRPPKTPRK